MRNTDKFFDGKIVAITGASSGIGKALAIALAQKGASLALADINQKELLNTYHLLADKTAVHITTLDVSDREAVQTWASDVVTFFGKINIIINNAGVYLKGSIEDSSFEEIKWLLNINLNGVIYGTKAFLPYLQASGEGYIVNMSSLFGLIAMPNSGIYSTSKFAIRGFTECLQQELELAKSCVTATCVFPAGINTGILTNARMAHESDFFHIQAAVIEKDKKVLTLAPEKVALIILDAILKKKKQVIIGKTAHLLNFIQRIFPIGYQWLTKKVAAAKNY